MGFIDRFRTSAYKVVVHEDRAGKYRVSIRDSANESVLIQVGFGFDTWYEARRFAAEIAQKRMEIQS